MERKDLILNNLSIAERHLKNEMLLFINSLSDPVLKNAIGKELLELYSLREEITELKESIGSGINETASKKLKSKLETMTNFQLDEEYGINGRHEWINYI